MTNVTDQDWELASAYCDDELEDAERAKFEARISQEPELEKALAELQMVSSALSALKPETQADSLPPPPAANRNWRPLGLCASAALALVLFTGYFLTKPDAPLTPMALHTSFVSQPFQVPEPNSVQQIRYSESDGTFDLEVANLYLVDQKKLPGDQLVAHYSGRNGCRLTVLSGAALPETELLPEIRVGTWEVAERDYAVIATGMDERRFAAIEHLLRQMTRSVSQPATVLAAKMASDNAAPCQNA